MEMNNDILKLLHQISNSFFIKQTYRKLIRNIKKKNSL